MTTLARTPLPDPIPPTPNVIPAQAEIFPLQHAPRAPYGQPNPAFATACP